jgi:hypothetical protein
LAFVEAEAVSDEGSKGAASGSKVRVFEIPQVVALNEVASRAVLPSFWYRPAQGEFPLGAVDCPWNTKKGEGADRLVGLFARDQGAKVPGRVVASSKSWLCHPGVDRQAAILPWTAADDVAKVSPVEAARAFLDHLRRAWNHTHAQPGDKARASAGNALEEQEILLTVPASFDPVARQLTLEAATLAGLNNVTLLEEPLAAFYAWLDAQGDSWRDQVKVGDLILVCDVGGGTTDFTLVAVEDRDGDLALRRAAVGDHLLLGGDNMDLALAYAAAATLPGGMERLDPIQRVALTHACRQAKETLLANPNLTTAPVVILGRGSKVIGGAIKTELTREVLERTLLEGFFPVCGPEASAQAGRKVGLSEIGLPYAAEPAITRQLAHFLTRQANSLHHDTASPTASGTRLVKPSAVLFNGGVFEAEPLRRRVLEVLSQWCGRPVPALETPGLDLAVARGAAHYGLVRKGRGIRVRGGVSRAFYLGIETAAPAVPGIKPPLKALCVVPMGMEEGTETDVPGPPLNLMVGEPARFHFLSSTTRRQDVPGTLLDHWSPNELLELEPVETTLPIEQNANDAAGAAPATVVPVRLHSRVTEVGVLDLSCRSLADDRAWKLEYNVREPR